MRDQRIDFIKGMLMWCVVYGHTINVLLSGTPHGSIWLHVFVRTFDMPFFMILSGYFLRRSLAKRSSFDLLVNRLTMILLPIVVWTLLLGRIDISNRYYFLWAVLISGIICIGGNRIASFFPPAIGKFLECIIYAGLIILFHVISLPWNLFYLFPFFVVGYYLNEMRFSLNKWGGGHLLLACVSGAIDTRLGQWDLLHGEIPQWR